MKVIFCTFGALLLYAAASVLLEQKLSRYSTVAVLILAYPCMLLFTAVRFTHLKQDNSLVFPTGTMILVVALVGVIWFFGDYLHLSAYGAGGKVENITSILALIPVFASLMKCATLKTIPNRYQVAAILLVPIVVWLASKGQVVQGSN